MSIKLGNTSINKIYLGNVEIKKEYLGEKVVYGSASQEDLTPSE